MKRLVISGGDPRRVQESSGTPHFFLKAGVAAGFIQGALPLDPSRLRWARYGWNAAEFFRTGRPGGFQYSEWYRNRLFSRTPDAACPDEFISLNQLLPPPERAGVRNVHYYIDATLRQLFEDYGLAAVTSPRVRREALAAERRNYQRAGRVVCFSRWAARSVVDAYGIPPAKVHVIPPGANLDEPLEAVETPVFPPDVWRLGMIAKDWKRKGLPFLLDVADALTARGQRVEVRVAGPGRSALPRHPLLRPAGPIDKERDSAGFARFVSSCHFGCLFSGAEAFGISNLEFLRFGIPVVAAGVGGIPETFRPDEGILLDRGDSAETAADRLLPFLESFEKYSGMREGIAAAAVRHSWSRTVRDFEELWRGSGRFAFGKDLC